MEQVISSQNHGNTCVFCEHIMLFSRDTEVDQVMLTRYFVVCINSIRLVALSIAVVLGKRHLPAQGQRNFSMPFEVALPHFR